MRNPVLRLNCKAKRRLLSISPENADANFGPKKTGDVEDTGQGVMRL